MVAPVALALIAVVALQAAPTENVSAKFRSATPCAKTYTQAQHARYARAVYARSEVTRAAQRRVGHLRRCQTTPKAQINAKRLTRRLRARYQERKVVDSLTPYNCGSHGRFAIPCYIVACESGYSWRAYNPSGATGPYQLLGKGVSLSDPPIVHHRVAAALWAGGRGASHWVCA